MLFLPYSTDAPLYHYPIATVGLIVANVLIFFATLAAEVNSEFSVIEGYICQYGDGLHPVQWLTANFLHADLFHLAGNMFGLWAFGLIVEGKIGWWRMLAVYLAMGVAVMFTIQLIALGLDGGCLGASGAIFGLLGIALIWAPQNDVNCIFWVFIYVTVVEMAVWILAAIYTALQVAFMLLSGFGPTTEMIHLTGLVAGLAVGVVMLRRGAVDCENWDLFSVWTGRHRMSRGELAALEREQFAPTAADLARQRQTALAELREVIAQGKVKMALAVHRRMASTSSDWKLPEPELRGLIVACLKQQEHSQAIVLMRNYLEQYASHAVPMRLKLAEVLLKHDRRPGLALRVLGKVPDAGLTPAYQQALDRLARQAEAAIAAGELDLQEDAW